MNSIGDILVGAALRVDIYNLSEKVEGADKLAAIVLQQSRELELALQDLKHKSSQINECKAVQDLETEADHIYRVALKKLFTEEKDPITLIKKKEILEMLEIAADMCQHTANVIIEILIKNS